jgi:hypothetical protein
VNVQIGDCAAFTIIRWSSERRSATRVSATGKEFNECIGLFSTSSVCSQAHGAKSLLEEPIGIRATYLADPTERGNCRQIGVIVRQVSWALLKRPVAAILCVYRDLTTSELLLSSQKSINTVANERCGSVRNHIYGAPAISWQTPSVPTTIERYRGEAGNSRITTDFSTGAESHTYAKWT